MLLVTGSRTRRDQRVWSLMAATSLVFVLLMLLTDATGASASPSPVESDRTDLVRRGGHQGGHAQTTTKLGAQSAKTQDDIEYFVNVLHDRVPVYEAAPHTRVAFAAAEEDLPVDPNATTTTTTTTTTTDPNKPWTNTPPSSGYPEGSTGYERRPPQEVKVGFFTKCWYVAIIILVVGVVLLYILLCVWICCHFDKSEQNKAKKVVQRSYEENGYFSIDGSSRGSSSASITSSNRARNAGTYEMNMGSGMVYEDAESVSVANTNPLNGDDYYA